MIKNFISQPRCSSKLHTVVYGVAIFEIHQKCNFAEQRSCEMKSDYSTQGAEAKVTSPLVRSSVRSHRCL